MQEWRCPKRKKNGITYKNGVVFKEVGFGIAEPRHLGSNCTTLTPSRAAGTQPKLIYAYFETTIGKLGQLQLNILKKGKEKFKFIWTWIKFCFLTRGIPDIKSSHELSETLLQTSTGSHLQLQLSVHVSIQSLMTTLVGKKYKFLQISCRFFQPGVIHCTFCSGIPNRAMDFKMLRLPCRFRFQNMITYIDHWIYSSKSKCLDSIFEHEKESALDYCSIIQCSKFTLFRTVAQSFSIFLC